MKAEQDAFGQEIYDYFKNQEAIEIVERDDGFVSISMGPTAYFSEYPTWSSHLQETMALVQESLIPMLDRFVGGDECEECEHYEEGDDDDSRCTFS